MGGINKGIVYQEKENGCWECTSHRPNSDGYPHLSIDYKKLKLHRYVYERFVGKIPEGLLVRHTCDNRMCVNPNHLVVGTIQDNTKDRVERNRSSKGNQIWNSALSEDKVIEIFNAEGCSWRELSRKYGVNPTTIQKIKKRISWKHITNNLN